MRLIHKWYAQGAFREERIQIQERRLKTHEKGMFSTQFWMTLLKTYFLHEMVMSSRVMAPHVQRPAPPKTYNMQGQPENRSQQNEVSEQGCIHWLTQIILRGRTLYTVKNRGAKMDQRLFRLLTILICADLISLRKLPPGRLRYIYVYEITTTSIWRAL